MTRHIILVLDYPERLVNGGTAWVMLTTVAQDSQSNGHDPLLDAVDVLIWLEKPGKPGIHVTKVSAAVKIVHRATGIEVVSDTEQTQLANRTRALAILRDRLVSRPA